MSDATAYPLQWPAGWPRTEQYRREHARFQQTLPASLNFLKKQVNLLQGKNLVLSSNCTLAGDNPKDCGVVAYFSYNNAGVAIPCDRWLRVEHNVYAIGLTIEAMRGMERWGAKHMITAMFSGFKQIEAQTGGISWWDVLGVPADSKADTIKNAYRDRAKVAHPDRGGSADRMAQLNAAYEMAMNQNGRL